jgi:hypothetical protein
MDTSTHSSFDMWFHPGPVSWHNLSTLFALFCCSLSVCSALSILKFRLIFAQHPSERESWKMRACCGWKLALQTVCFISQYWTRLTSSSFLCVCAKAALFKEPMQPLPLPLPPLLLLCWYAEFPATQHKEPFSPPAARSGSRVFHQLLSKLWRRQARMYYNWPAEWLNASQLENSAARSSGHEFFILRARDERVEI